MVRRLIRRFLHWLRQLLTRLGETKRRHPLPSSRQLPPTLSPGANPPSPPPHRPTSPLGPPLNPASHRVNNPSNFQVLLGTRQYFPSPAIQELSQQLAQTDAKTTSARKQSLIPADIIQATAGPKPTKENTQNSLVIKETTDLALPEATAPPAKSCAETNIQISEPQSSSSLPTGQQTLPLSPALADISQAPPGAITKQGVVKLLFKLKKNNYHGYIAPNDGSKDIIFHQKYIGDRVFGRLEQGMAVEVTAHITEGKAYADSVRIL